MIEIADRIESIIQDVSRNHDGEVECIAFDLNGLTGHIDHIVASRAATLAFYRLKANDSRFIRLRLACLPHELYPAPDTNWLFMEAGRHPDEIDETVDARDMRDKIIEIIHMHHSQRHDGETMIHTFGELLGMNYFIVKE